MRHRNRRTPGPGPAPLTRPSPAPAIRGSAGILRPAVLCACIVLFGGCSDLTGGGGGYGRDPYADPYYDGDRGYPPPGGYYPQGRDPYGRRRRDEYDRERRRLRDEEERLREERRRLDEERRRPSYGYPPPAAPPPPREESCPPGFRPSDQKCSPQERRRGCRDMRLPGGLGCVRR